MFQPDASRFVDVSVSGMKTRRNGPGRHFGVRRLAAGGLAGTLGPYAATERDIMTYSSPTRPGYGLVATTAVAGALSTVAFDFFGQSLSPGLGFANLAPVPLANQTIETIFGAPWTPGAHFLHYFAGMVAYPLGWILIAEPLRARILPAMPWWAAAVVYGIGLWIFALYIMAHLIAGNPAFLGFGGITWVALTGHVLFALVTAAVVRRMQPAAG
jgi:hypothetical protein